ncbi:hypothetical protein [Paenibacillus sp. FSL H3-0469]|uniref:hypothetical protein n=1 Tax=Paenibacillus sp. FSL H3-0469 TaxID=2954506 RepID=UPI0031017A39
MDDTHRLQKELKQRNIRVLPDEQEELLVLQNLLPRLQERFGLTRDVMRIKISLRLTKYTVELAGVLKDNLKK